MKHEQKPTATDLVEVACLALIGAGAWGAWSFWMALVIVGGIGLSVALFSRLAPRRRPNREGTG